MRRTTRSVVAVAVAALVARSALAAPSGAKTGNEEQAKMLFTVGAEAYSSGQYKAAIQAFSEANKILPRPAIVFSLAQAHRRQYVIDKEPEHVRQAARLFRDYLAQVPEGGRRNEATQALEELEPMEQRMGGEAAGKGASAASAREPARLMVTSRPAGASVVLDGKPGKPTPFGPEVTPGPHKIVVTSAGYYDEEREVLAIDNTLVPVPIDLREKPAKVSIEAPNGSQVSVDGRFAGTTPLSAPLDVPSGEHYVVVTRNGYRAYAEDVAVARDEHKTIKVKLAATGQRTIAWSLIATGVAAAVVGGVFTGVSLHNQHAAEDILDARSTRNLSPADQSDYAGDVRSRNDWRTAAYVAYGVGAAAFLTGVVFYVFDQPRVTPPPRRTEEKPKAPAPTGPSMTEPMMEMSWSVAPGGATAGVRGRF